jgi:hypothetical protein
VPDVVEMPCQATQEERIRVEMVLHDLVHARGEQKSIQA